MALIGVSMAATNVHAETGSERAAGVPDPTKDFGGASLGRLLHAYAPLPMSREAK